MRVVPPVSKVAMMRSESLTKLSWFGDDDRYELELFHLKQLNGNLFYENVLERERKKYPTGFVTVREGLPEMVKFELCAIRE